MERVVPIVHYLHDVVEGVVLHHHAAEGCRRQHLRHSNTQTQRAASMVVWVLAAKDACKPCRFDMIVRGAGTARGETHESLVRSALQSCQSARACHGAMSGTDAPPALIADHTCST